jgi:hypothetical protein
MKTIYNVAVLMDSQEQCDRMKQLCIDNGLPIWEDEIAFEYSKDFQYFTSYQDDKQFFIGYHHYLSIYELITEAEFIELLKKHKA